MDYKVNGFDLRNLATRGSSEKTRALGALIKNTEGREGDSLRMAGDAIKAADHKMAPKIHEMLFGKESESNNKKEDDNSYMFTDKTYGDYGDVDDSAQAMAYQKRMLMGKKKDG